MKYKVECGEPIPDSGGLRVGDVIFNPSLKQKCVIHGYCNGGWLLLYLTENRDGFTIDDDSEFDVFDSDICYQDSDIQYGEKCSYAWKTMASCSFIERIENEFWQI